MIRNPRMPGLPCRDRSAEPSPYQREILIGLQERGDAGDWIENAQSARLMLGHGWIEAVGAEVAGARSIKRRYRLTGAGVEALRRRAG